MQHGWTRLFLVSTLCVLSLFLGEPAKADSEFADLPPPNRLVEVEGYRLHINCTDAGTPTVILEEGAGGGSLNWTWIQRKVAATMRVCSYDRPGHAWSDSTETPGDAETVSRGLDALLKAAGEKGLFVAVGHSLGGPYARMFTARQDPAARVWNKNDVLESRADAGDRVCRHAVFGGTEGLLRNPAWSQSGLRRRFPCRRTQISCRRRHFRPIRPLRAHKLSLQTTAP